MRKVIVRIRFSFFYPDWITSAKYSVASLCFCRQRLLSALYERLKLTSVGRKTIVYEREK